YRGFHRRRWLLERCLLCLLGLGLNDLHHTLGLVFGRLPLARGSLGGRRGGARTRLGRHTLPRVSLLCRALARGRFPYHVDRLTLTKGCTYGCSTTGAYMLYWQLGALKRRLPT